MNKYLRGTEKSKLIYNYSALTTNVIMNYVKHKAGADWDKLLHKVFNEHVGVKNSVQFQKSRKYLKYKRGDFPIAEKMADTSLSLPVHEFIKETDIKYVVNLINKFY